MEIKYLEKMKNNPIIKGFKNRGVGEINIHQLEKKLNLIFPIAYKEFLFLGGEGDNVIQGGWEGEFENLEYMQELAQSVVLDEGLLLRSFWCFAEYNDAESFLFFYFDEGDDPPIYNFIAEKILKDENGKKVSFKNTKDSFSEYINRSIENVIK